MVLIVSCFVDVDFHKLLSPCRNQPVKKLTMGYITNYSYCTAMVSSSVFNILQARVNISKICMSYIYSPSHGGSLIIFINVVTVRALYILDFMS